MSLALRQTRILEMQRHIMEQQVQDSTQEEENPPCNNEGEEESLSFDEENDETDCPCRDWLESRR